MMERASLRRTFANDFRQFFIRGLVVLLPSVLTIWIVVQAYRFVDKNVAQPINAGVRLAVIEAVPYFVPLEDQPEWFQVSDQAVANEISIRQQQGLPPVQTEIIRTEIRKRALKAWWDKHPSLNFIGLGVAVVLFYLSGRILGSYLGRRITDRIERLIARVPIFKQVYPYVKQVVDFVLGERQIEFKSVVAVPYPRVGIWAVGFVTGRPLGAVTRHTGEEMVTVFIPSSPTPFTGYTIIVRRADVIELDLGVEQALRYVVSGGVLNPEQAPLGQNPAAEPTLPATSANTAAAAAAPMPQRASTIAAGPTGLPGPDTPTATPRANGGAGRGTGIAGPSGPTRGGEAVPEPSAADGFEEPAGTGLGGRVRPDGTTSGTHPS